MSVENTPGAKGSRKVNIEISEEIRRGCYANRLIVSHTSEEFVLDFVSDLPPRPQIVSRIVTSPSHAKEIVRAIEANVSRFEARHGTILSHRDTPPPTSADA